MGKHIKKIAIPAVIVLIACIAVGVIALITNRTKSVDEHELAKEDIATGSAGSLASLHDPMVLVTEENELYMYGSHMTMAYGKGLSDWEMLADGVRNSNRLFQDLVAAPFDAFSFVGKNTEGGYSVWAPTVIYNKAMEKYVMYFCTTSSFIKSNICIATSDTPEGPFVYQDTILYSGFTKNDVDQTDFYEVMGEDVKLSTYTKSGTFVNEDWPNCIDPAVFYDADGKMWMVYGSWSGGIFLLEVDEETGDVIHPEGDPKNGVDKYYGRRLVGGGHHAVEGPYIQYCPENGYYYLLLSYGELTSNGGYQMREFRSRNVEGPYVDAAGKTLGYDADFENFGVKMAGNYTLPSLDVTYMAPGGQSSFTTEDGKMYMVYHQRFDDNAENHQPRVHQLFISQDDWLVMAPFETAGESLSEDGYEMEDVCGTFYMINHGLDISASKRKIREVTFSSNGTISGDISGSFTVEDGTNYITVTLDGIAYQGTLVEMPDEAGNRTLCFSAVGTNNKTLWGVHYMQKED